MRHAISLRQPSAFGQTGTKATLLMGTALQATVMLVLAQPAGAQPAPNAHPLGGSVVGGAATISRTPNNTSINQSTQRAAIDWQSFDVGSQQRVTFNQPSSSAATLNRITGPDPSRIAGRIDANGHVVLLNQSGVVFYKGAQVNTNGSGCLGHRNEQTRASRASSTRASWRSTRRAIRTRASKTRAPSRSSRPGSPRWSHLRW